MTEFSVIIPVYNSEKTIEELCKKIMNVFDLEKKSYEIILVDDCSTDNSWKQIQNFVPTNQNIKAIRLSNNYGQWMSTLAGIKKSTGNYIITIDDDLEYDPRDIPKIIEQINDNQYYIVFGISKNKYHLQGKNSSIASIRNKFVNFIWNKYTTDSFKIFKRRVLFDENDIFLCKIHFEAFINFSIHPKYIGYCEVGYNKRQIGKSNYSFIKKLKMFFRYSIDYYQFPSKGISFILTIIFLLSIFLEYFVFKGKLNGLLLAIMGFTQICLSLIIVQYSAQIYFSGKKIPEFWHLESINFEKQSRNSEESLI